MQPSLLQQLQNRLPGITFKPGSTFLWSPKQQSITYRPEVGESERSTWALLHETAHALLDHQQYRYDIDLLMLEAEAWEEAKKLAGEFDIHIDEDHIQDCLDTYRDWLHQRATCPRCSTVSLQSEPRTYACHNCAATWRVSASRFCRPYRRQSLVTSDSDNKKPSALALGDSSVLA